VVDGLDFDVRVGETFAIAGESGSGKSMTALALMGLLPGAARVAAGQALLAGTDLLGLTESEMRRRRGRDLAMIFQEPMTSLNPVLTIGTQLIEAIRAHASVPRAEALAGARRLLDWVRIPDAARRLGQYPHELSGGMRQRVMIAMALASRPKLLIADEPTTALDVTVQAQILALIRDLQREIGAAVILITHDMGVVAEMAATSRCCATGARWRKRRSPNSSPRRRRRIRPSCWPRCRASAPPGRPRRCRRRGGRWSTYGS
jgi:peptide/nickel transport system ATP-binding protein